MTAQTTEVTALQTRWDAAERERRAAKRDLAAARRRAGTAARIQAGLEAEARRLDFELVITRHSPEA